VGWINDFADAFEPREEMQMDSLARETLYKAGVELCVVTVRRLKLSSPQSYASKLAEYWGLGRRTGNRCLLLLAVMARQQATLDVGYELRSVVRISVAPGAVHAGVRRLLADLRLLTAPGEMDSVGGMAAQALRLLAVVGQLHEPGGVSCASMR
jgi:hypothetical protein